MLIIVLLFRTLENLKQLIYQKILFLKIVGIYKKNIAFKSLDNSIGTILKNPEMIKFVPDNLKTKKMCKYAVEKLPNKICS